MFLFRSAPTESASTASPSQQQQQQQQQQPTKSHAVSRNTHLRTANGTVPLSIPVHGETGARMYLLHNKRMADDAEATATPSVADFHLVQQSEYANQPQTGGAKRVAHVGRKGVKGIARKESLEDWVILSPTKQNP